MRETLLVRDGRSAVLMLMSDPFQSARRKLARGRKHIADLEAELRVFNDSDPYARTVEAHPRYPDQVQFKVKLVRAIPDELSEIVSDAACNIRDSLDHAIYGIAAANGSTPREAYFPFAGDCAAFDNALKGRCRDVPQQIYPLLRALQPYKGGNDFLWALNQICIPNKHKILMPTCNGSLIRRVQVTGMGFAVNRDPVWDRAKNEIVLLNARSDAQFNHDLNFTFFVAFQEIPIIDGKPVDAVMNNLAGMVDGVLETLEVEARRLCLIS